MTRAATEDPAPRTTGGRTPAENPAERLADRAVAALRAEALLTPKPGLVDRRGGGAHEDMDPDLLLRSADALRPAFEAAARAASREGVVGARLRGRLGWIGRAGERRMSDATGGVNAHRGALWSLGLLVAAAALPGAPGPPGTVPAVTSRASLLARLPDPATEREPDLPGARARRRFRTGGAVGQARAGFPHVVDVALPALRRSRSSGAGEDPARLDALLALMSTLDDTCVLHRGGPEGLALVRRGAGAVLEAGGCASARGLALLDEFDLALNARKLSPGGSGDLLAATLFLDGLYAGEPAGTVPDEPPGARQTRTHDGGDGCRP